MAVFLAVSYTADPTVLNCTFCRSSDVEFSASSVVAMPTFKADNVESISTREPTPWPVLPGPPAYAMCQSSNSERSRDRTRSYPSNDYNTGADGQGRRTSQDDDVLHGPSPVPVNLHCIETVIEDEITTCELLVTKVGSIRPMSDCVSEFQQVSGSTMPQSPDAYPKLPPSK